jgi:hypothetical protein
VLWLLIAIMGLMFEKAALGMAVLKSVFRQCCVNFQVIRDCSIPETEELSFQEIIQKSLPGLNLLRYDSYVV